MIFDFIFLSELTSGSSYLEKGPEKETDFISGYVVEDIDNSVLSFFYNPLFFQNSKSFCLAFQQ